MTSLTVRRTATRPGSVVAAGGADTAADAARADAGKAPMALPDPTHIGKERRVTGARAASAPAPPTSLTADGMSRLLLSLSSCWFSLMTTSSKIGWKLTIGPHAINESSKKTLEKSGQRRAPGPASR